VARERWVKKEGARNESWDTLIYARAAFDALCVLGRRQHDALVRQFAAEMRAKPAAAATDAPAPPAREAPSDEPTAPAAKDRFTGRRALVSPRIRTKGWNRP
jgi:phage terminase large subunit GpA-like protein